MFITESRRDFRQRYRTCTVIANYCEQQFLFYIDDVDEDMDYISGSVIDENDSWSPTRWNVEDVQIDFKFPELGLLNAKKGVVRLSRYSTQQYRQSFNERVINITAINSQLMEIFNLPVFNYEDLKQPKFIKDIFFPSYFTASGLINRITSGDRYAGAISKDLYLTTSWSSEGIYLGYKDVTVGKVRSNYMHPTVDLFEGNNDLVDIILLEGIRIGGMLNVQR
tara:strand:- start:3530 stop:4198 length:669 start_codon:yes stop_codon:yes gene_type:complete